ncbi:hypothetical protein pipiens_012889 [Culex pipiens pipiens]|uniref:DNA replication ATP-dependent helicase/nuclease n=1 Tax=Culex pipiens pipiens TaxID=38569 RepID=A0ABD1D0M1_CULPP
MFNESELDGLFDDDDDDTFGLDLQALEDAEKFTLDLSEWRRCRIESVLPHENRTVTLIVSDKATGATKAKCVLEPPWTGLQFVVGATVSIMAGFDRCAQVYRVSNQDGMIVTDPDYLVSGTSVVGALYCQRRGVLQERFRGVDKDSKLMMIGTIVHELLQRTLRNKLTDMSDIVSLGKTYLASNEMAHMLYGCSMTKADAIKEIEPFYAKIHSFVTKHFASQLPKKPFFPPSGDSQVQIHAVRDIEENIWCHQLGLKGKIDVTVDARCNSNQPLQVMPLELKTGRASFSAEHKGQLVLYEMMMNLVGHKVENGILLYLREGKCAPVSGNRNIKRDLIMLRNEVANFLSKSLPNVDSADFDLAKDTLQLPEPLNNAHVCSRCPYAVICTAHLQREGRDLPADHSIKLIADESLSHLSDRHIDYFIRWAGLTYLEDQETRKSFKLKHIWTKSVEERHKMGRAFGNLRLSGRVICATSEYYHNFSVDSLLPDGTQSQNAHERLTSFFESNQYLICSTSKRVAVAAGRVITVGKRDITMSFERDLSRHYADEQFTLDSYESNSSTTFNLTNLGVLLENTERSAALRRIIVDREKPRFAKTISPDIVTAAKEILGGLNKHQRVAILSAVGTDSYCLFKGLPGTGKTQTVIALIRLLVAMGKSVLITSNTHSAVDNVLRRLQPHGIKFLRLGASSRVDAALAEFTDGIVTEKCSTPEELAAVYDSYKIVGVTCLGAAHSMLVQRTFDYCIVDEATQVFQSAVIRPLLYADKFVLIGDPDQLPPVIRSHKAKDLGADESLFFRLDAPESCCELPTQYRMNKTITALANDLSYRGKLTCATEAVASATIKYATAPAMQKKHKSEKWLLRVIASQQEMSVVVINTLNTYKTNLDHIVESQRELGQMLRQGAVEEVRRTAIYENFCEAAVILYTVMTMFEGGVDSSSIGIIAPFRAQVELLRRQFQLLKKFYESQKDTKDQAVDVEINTVDQFQGRDKDVIFYSCTKSVDPDQPENKKASEYEVLEDHKRLTVAMTRAKQKLIIVGDTKSLDKYTPFRNLFKLIHPATKVTLQDHAFGFEWSCVFNVLNALQDCADQ